MSRPVAPTNYGMMEQARRNRPTRPIGNGKVPQRPKEFYSLREDSSAVTYGTIDDARAAFARSSGDSAASSSSSSSSSARLYPGMEEAGGHYSQISQAQRASPSSSTRQSPRRGGSPSLPPSRTRPAASSTGSRAAPVSTTNYASIPSQGLKNMAARKAAAAAGTAAASEAPSSPSSSIAASPSSSTAAIEEASSHYGAIRSSKDTAAAAAAMGASRPSAAPPPSRRRPPVPLAQAGADVYLVVCEYTAESAKEVSLEVGDRVAVQIKDDGGWWKGRCLRTQVSGWFPADWVVPEDEAESNAEESEAEKRTNQRVSSPVVVSENTHRAGRSPLSASSDAYASSKTAAAAAAIAASFRPPGMLQASRRGNPLSPRRAMRRSKSIPTLPVRNAGASAAPKPLPKPLPKAPDAPPPISVPLPTSSATGARFLPQRQEPASLRSYGPLAQLTRLPTRAVQMKPAPGPLANALLSPRAFNAGPVPNRPPPARQPPSPAAAAAAASRPLPQAVPLADEDGGSVYSPLASVKRPGAAPGRRGGGIGRGRGAPLVAARRAARGPPMPGTRQPQLPPVSSRKTSHYHESPSAAKKSSAPSTPEIDPRYSLLSAVPGQTNPNDDDFVVELL